MDILTQRDELIQSVRATNLVVCMPRFTQVFNILSTLCLQLQITLGKLSTENQDLENTLQ